MRLFLLVTLILLGLSALAQVSEKTVAENALPKEVLARFKADYPALKTQPHYYRISENGLTLYEAEWQETGKTVSVTYTQQGSIYETEKELAFEDIPETVKAEMLHVMQADFAKSKVKSAELVTNEHGSHFELKIRGKKSLLGVKLYELTFNGEGRLLDKNELELEPIITLF